MSIVNTKGVDISSHNGNIDLAKVKKAGYKWVMIRCGYGDNITSQDDSQFEANVKKAEALGMPWGVYFYTYSLNAKQDKSELEHILRLLKGKKPTLPIAIDVEDADGYKRKNGGWNYANVNRNTKYLLEGVKKAGYYPILYTGFEEINNLISKEVSGRYDVWFAHWAKKCGYTGKNLAIWQYGSETNLIDGNSIPGVGTIDKDIVYKDYPTIIKNGGYNNWKKPDKTTTTTKTETKKETSKSTTTTITEAQLRQKVCNTINAWLGATEGSAGHKEILKIYNAQNPLPVGYKMKDNDAWCAATVSATWLKVGIAKYITTECGCGRFIDNAKKLGIWVENDAYKPKIGDAVIYYWSDSGFGDCRTGASHIGIVTEVNGNSFVVTEGNTGNGIVGKRTMQVNGRYIRGFITPDYAAIAKKVAGKVTADKTTTKKTSTTTSTVATPSIYTQGVANGKWLNAVKDGSDYSGIIGKALVALAAKVTKGTIEYSVHIKGHGWLGKVTGFNHKDYKNGYAGNGNPAEKGNAIDGVKMYYRTPSDVANKYGYYKVAYRVHLLGGKWLAWQYDKETTNGQDGYAGIIGKTIDGIQAKLIKA